MPKGRIENLKSIGERTMDEQREITKKGGKASGIARLNKKHSREAAILLASLPSNECDNEILKEFGIPENDLNKQMAMLVALYKKALTGDASAIRLYLEIMGEAPKQELNLIGDMKFNSGGLQQTLEALKRQD